MFLYPELSFGENDSPTPPTDADGIKLSNIGPGISFTCKSGSRGLFLYWRLGIMMMRKGLCLFVLKTAPQRGEGEKREGVHIAKQSTQNL